MVRSIMRRRSALLLVVFFVLGFFVVFLPPWLWRRSKSEGRETSNVATIPEDPRCNAEIDAMVQAVSELQTSSTMAVASKEPDPKDGGFGSQIEGAGNAPNREASGHWSDYPRTSDLFSTIVVHGPLESTRLFRNRSTNPRDLEIPPAYHEDLNSYCSDMAANMAELERVKSTAAFADFSELMARGRARSHNLAERRSRLSPQEREIVSKAESRLFASMAMALGKPVGEIEASPASSVIVPDIDFSTMPLTYTVKDGIVYSATPKDLPNANNALKAQRWATFELGHALAQYFLNHGCLSKNEADDLMKEVVAEIERALGS